MSLRHVKHKLTHFLYLYVIAFPLRVAPPALLHFERLLHLNIQLPLPERYGSVFEMQRKFRCGFVDGIEVLAEKPKIVWIQYWVIPSSSVKLEF